MSVLRGASERPIFNECFCSAFQAIHFKRAFMWRDEKWRALDETRSMSVFVARLKRLTFNERFCAASEATHFQRAFM